MYLLLCLLMINELLFIALFIDSNHSRMSREDPDPYIFTSDSLPLDERFLPPLANGLLGWRVFNGIMHMGGVYNGQLGQCHRADIPCPLAATLHLKEPSEHTFTLDTRKGTVLLPH